MIHNLYLIHKIKIQAGAWLFFLHNRFFNAVSSPLEKKVETNSYFFYKKAM